MSKTYLKSDHFNGGGSLEQEITGVRAALPLPAIVASGIDLKAFEDALDAVICAWVAISALEDWANPMAMRIPRSGFLLAP
jgi:predicted RNase H-like nuclease